jgi:hypothetical protein
MVLAEMENNLPLTNTNALWRTEDIQTMKYFHLEEMLVWPMMKMF